VQASRERTHTVRGCAAFTQPLRFAIKVPPRLAATDDGRGVRTETLPSGGPE
jgi:hypothetical protein